MKFDEWYFEVLGFFEENRVPVFIHGSTLLGAVRERQLLQRIPFDNELNFGIRSRDLTMDLLYKMKKHFPYFQADGEKLENSLIYFGPEPIIRYHSQNQDHWHMKPGIGLLATFWEGKTKWIEYMGWDICLTWPKEQLEEFNVVHLSGRNVSTPKNPSKWLSNYFGDDWGEEKRDWHWISDSHNRESLTDLIKGGEL
jgi:hypothetical protein